MRIICTHITSYSISIIFPFVWFTCYAYLPLFLAWHPIVTSLRFEVANFILLDIVILCFLGTVRIHCWATRTVRSKLLCVQLAWMSLALKQSVFLKLGYNLMETHEIVRFPLAIQSWIWSSTFQFQLLNLASSNKIYKHMNYVIILCPPKKRTHILQ